MRQDRLERRGSALQLASEGNYDIRVDLRRGIGHYNSTVAVRGSGLQDSSTTQGTWGSSASSFNALRRRDHSDAVGSFPGLPSRNDGCLRCWDAGR